MSEHMKRPLTDLTVTDRAGHTYIVPEHIIKDYQTSDGAILADEFFAPYEKNTQKMVCCLEAPDCAKASPKQPLQA